MLLLVQGCIYPFKADIESESAGRIAVSGDILIGETTRIALSYVYPLGSTVGEMRKEYPKGTLVIEHDSGASWKGTYQYHGIYTFDTSSAPAAGRYRLKISLNDGREFLSDWAGAHQAPVITDFYYSGNSDGVSLYLSLDGADSLWNFRWDYTETWEYHSDFIPSLFFVPGVPEADRNNPEKIYREPAPEEIKHTCWNSYTSVEPCLQSVEGQSDNYFKDNRFRVINSSDLRISSRYSMLITVCGVSSGAMAYLKHLAAMSNETGSLFAPTPSEMRGNIGCVSDPSEVALGYVEAVCRTTKRIYVPGSFYRRNYDPDLLLFYPEPDEDGYYNFEQIFMLGDAPATGEPSLTGVRWAPKRCTDCTALGGVTTAPVWWEEK